MLQRPKWEAYAAVWNADPHKRAPTNIGRGSMRLAKRRPHGWPVGHHIETNRSQYLLARANQSCSSKDLSVPGTSGGWAEGDPGPARDTESQLNTRVCTMGFKKEVTCPLSIATSDSQESTSELTEL